MIQREQLGDVLTLHLRHGKANVMDLEFLAALTDAVDQADGARALVLTGHGSIFSAGVDLKRILDGGQDYVREFLPLLDAVFAKLFSLPLPVIAAINGHAIAGGCILAQVCDYRVVADGRGRMGIPELLVGVPFPFSALESLRYRVPAASLEGLVGSGATLPPQAARDAGLVDEVAEASALLPRALEIASQRAALAPAAFAMSKRTLRAPCIARMRDEGPAYNARALEHWQATDTFDRIRSYLDRTLGAGKA